MNWVRKAIDLVKLRETPVLVTIVAAEGSSPREAGAKMLVTLG